MTQDEKVEADELKNRLIKREHYFRNASEGEYDAELLRKARYRIDDLEAALAQSQPTPDKDWREAGSEPAAMTVMAARFDDDGGEWVYGVVLTPLSYPFTHWRLLPDPPAIVSVASRG